VPAQKPLGTADVEDPPQAATVMDADDEGTTYLAKSAKTAKKEQAKQCGSGPPQVAISVHQRFQKGLIG